MKRHLCSIECQESWTDEESKMAVEKEGTANRKPFLRKGGDVISRHVSFNDDDSRHTSVHALLWRTRVRTCTYIRTYVHTQPRDLFSQRRKNKGGKRLKGA